MRPDITTPVADTVAGASVLASVPVLVVTFPAPDNSTGASVGVACPTIGSLPVATIAVASSVLPRSPMTPEIVDAEPNSVSVPSVVPTCP